MPYAYRSETTSIPDVTGGYCPVCGEAVLDLTESTRTRVAMAVFNKQPMSMRFILNTIKYAKTG
jgi:HTH-type transcriptional regulator/antitoxin MqsA